MSRVTVLGGKMAQAEIDAYVRYATEKYGREPDGLTIEVDGEYVNLDLHFHDPFARIRRLTGYLSQLNNFNSGKRAEERDRVKHGI